MAAGLPLLDGPAEDAGAPQHEVNHAGPASAGEPAAGDSKPKTDADAGAGSPQTPEHKEGELPDDDAAVIGLLQEYGLKPEVGSQKTEDKGEGAAAAAAGNEKPNNEGDINKLVEQIKKEINADGSVPLDQQVEKLAAMAAAGQQQIGKVGQEVGTYRKLFDTLTAEKWFDQDATGKLTPNIVNLADALPLEKFTEQIQSPEAQEKLAARGLKIVPLDFTGETGTGKDDVAAFEEAAAAKLVPGKELSHEERMRVIEDNKALERRFSSEVAALKLKADADAGAKQLRSEAQLTQARQEVQSTLGDMAKANPQMWEKLAPGIAHYGAMLPGSIPHMEGLKFAIGRAFHDAAPQLIADALRKGIAIGRKQGQGDAGLLVAPGGSGGGANAGRMSSDAGIPAADRAKAGLPPVE